MEVEKRDSSKCISCGTCINECPLECFGEIIEQDNFSECMGCYTCLDECKSNAIIIKGIS